MQTTSLGLKKPEGDDIIDIQDFNDNADIIDAELAKRPFKTGDASNMTNTFSQAASLTNLAPGETQKISFGKLMKAIADYISHKATAATASVLGHVRFGTIAGTACQGNDNRLSDTRMPKSHASGSTTYGIGTADSYGHVKLADDCTKISNGTSGMAASPKAVSDIYNQMDAWIGFSNQIPVGNNINECLHILNKNLNPLKAKYLTGNIDSIIDLYTSDYPYIFGRSDKLNPILGFWVFVTTYYMDSANTSHCAQLAVGSNGKSATRYYSTDRTGWTDWLCPYEAMPYIGQQSQNINITASGSYTATQNCYVIIDSYRTTTQGLGAITRVGSIDIAKTENTTPTAFPLLPIKKGQIISWNSYTRGTLRIISMSS